MKTAKCSICSQEVSEVGQVYYEAVWKNKKVDFGLAGEKRFFCENCWKEKEEYYRNYPCDSEEITRAITKYEIEKNPNGYYCHGYCICYDPAKKEWVKEKPTFANSENKSAGKGNDNLIIWVILTAIPIILLIFLGYLWHKRKGNSRKRQK